MQGAQLRLPFHALSELPMITTSWDHLEPEQMSDTITRQMFTGVEATVARFYLAKGAFVARHSHVSEQYTIVLSGALRLIFDDGEVVARQGEIVYISANEAHAAQAVEDTWVIDFFAPRREDWLQKNDAYLRK
jgi:quercetin dioxygenase-like cupin family protein